jgi:hypothetical protein
MEKKSPALGIVAAVLILVTGVYLYMTQFAGPPKPNLKPFENLGFVVAEETAKLLKGSGRVTVITEVFEGMKSPNTEAQVNGFKIGVGKNKGLTLKDVKEFKRPIVDDPQHWPAGTAGRFANMAEGSSATVLFVNVPRELSKEDVAAFKECQSKLVVICAPSPAVKTLLQEKAIALAMVSRFPPKPAPEGKESPREWFDRVYMAVTPETIALLP